MSLVGCATNATQKHYQLYAGNYGSLWPHGHSMMGQGAGLPLRQAIYVKTEAWLSIFSRLAHIMPKMNDDRADLT